MTYGYIRVSSKDQNEDRQLIALREAGVSEKHIEMVLAQWQQGVISARAAADQLGISRQTFLNWTRKSVKNCTL